MNFFTLLAFTTNGTKRTTLCEGRWLDDADGCRTVRLDSAEFPSFWLSGMTGPGGDDFVVTGGRIDASWGDERIPHTQFMTRVCPAGIEVYCDGFSVLIPVRAPSGTANDIDTPAGQSSKRGLFIDSSGGCAAIRLSRDVDAWTAMDLVCLDAHVPFGMKNMQAIRSGDRMFELWFVDSGTPSGQRNNTVESITGLEFLGGGLRSFSNGQLTITNRVVWTTTTTMTFSPGSLVTSIATPSWFDSRSRESGHSRSRESGLFRDAVLFQ